MWEKLRNKKCVLFVGYLDDFFEVFLKENCYCLLCVGIYFKFFYIMVYFFMQYCFNKLVLFFFLLCRKGDWGI